MIDIIPGKPEHAMALVRAAAEDGHSVLEATHIIKKDGRICGFLAVGSVPMFFGWLHSDRTTNRDSLTALEFVEAEAKAHGARFIFLPTGSESPLTPYLPKVGFHKLKFDQVWIKQLQEIHNE